MTNKFRVGIFDPGNGCGKEIRTRLIGDARFEAVVLKTVAGMLVPEDGGAAPELLVVCIAPDNPEIGEILLRQIQEQFRRFESARLTQGLSDREKQVLALHQRGLSRVQVAEQLGISYFTVRRHIQNVLDKTGISSVRNLLELASFETSPLTPLHA